MYKATPCRPIRASPPCPGTATVAANTISSLYRLSRRDLKWRNMRRNKKASPPLSRRVRGVPAAGILWGAWPSDAGAECEAGPLRQQRDSPALCAVHTVAALVTWVYFQAQWDAVRRGERASGSPTHCRLRRVVAWIWMPTQGATTSGASSGSYARTRHRAHKACPVPYSATHHTATPPLPLALA